MQRAARPNPKKNTFTLFSKAFPIESSSVNNFQLHLSSRRKTLLIADDAHIIRNYNTIYYVKLEIRRKVFIILRGGI